MAKAASWNSSFEILTRGPIASSDGCPTGDLGEDPVSSRHYCVFICSWLEYVSNQCVRLACRVSAAREQPACPHKQCAVAQMTNDEQPSHRMHLRCAPHRCSGMTASAGFTSSGTPYAPGDCPSLAATPVATSTRSTPLAPTVCTGTPVESLGRGFLLSHTPRWSSGPTAPRAICPVWKGLNWCSIRPQDTICFTSSMRCAQVGTASGVRRVTASLRGQCIALSQAQHKSESEGRRRRQPERASTLALQKTKASISAGGIEAGCTAESKSNERTIG
jgi:hypothetical protein